MNIDKLGIATLTPATTQKSDQLGQDDFLKILVAQMNNQDPTNPADNAEFLGQMAQFSMVSGINSLDSSMQGVLGSAEATRSLQASSLVNREVLIETSTVNLGSGRSVDGQIATVPGASGINVQVRDAYGNLVRTLATEDIGNQRLAFSWDGTSEAGMPLDPANFTISARALVGIEQLDLPVFSFVRVDGVKVDPDSKAISLTLANDQTASLNNVAQYR